MVNDLVKKLNEFEVNIKCLQTSLSSFKMKEKSKDKIHEYDNEILKMQKQLKNILALKLKNEKIKNMLLKSKKSNTLGLGHRCYKISYPTKHKELKQIKESNSKFSNELRSIKKSKNDEFINTIYNSMINLSNRLPNIKIKLKNSLSSKVTLHQKQIFCQAFLNAIPQLLDSQRALQMSCTDKTKYDTKNFKEILTKSISKYHYKLEATFFKLQQRLDNVVYHLQNLNKSIIYQKDTFKMLCLRIRNRQKLINEKNLNIEQLEEQIGQAHKCNQRLLLHIKGQNQPF